MEVGVGGGRASWGGRREGKRKWKPEGGKREREVK
jgi:hypothetical protein